MSATALLRMTGIACVRGGRLLFDSLDLTLQPGSAMLVTGPNGAGKSSLIRLAAGLLRPAAGAIERHAQLALADEAHALDPRLPLARALAFWAELDGSDAATAMATMGIDHLGDVPVAMLSTGQKKRASIARVMASRAPLWLLDEPANGLDADGQVRLAAAMAEHRRTGGAVLAASHQSIGLEAASTIELEAA